MKKPPAPKYDLKRQLPIFTVISNEENMYNFRTPKDKERVAISKANVQFYEIVSETEFKHSGFEGYPDSISKQLLSEIRQSIVNGEDLHEHKAIELLSYIVEKTKTGQEKNWIKNLGDRAKRTVKKYKIIIKEDKVSK